MHDKLKMLKERINTNFHGQDIPYNMYWKATVALKIDSVYKESKIYHPKVCVEEWKYTDEES